MYNVEKYFFTYLLQRYFASNSLNADEVYIPFTVSTDSIKRIKHQIETTEYNTKRQKDRTDKAIEQKSITNTSNTV